MSPDTAAKLLHLCHATRSGFNWAAPISAFAMSTKLWIPRSIKLLGGLIGATAGQAAVVINEIHPSPDVDQERVEFIELFNDGDQAAQLDGWRVTGGIGFTFPSGFTIAPYGFLVLAQDPSALALKFGHSGAVGPWAGRLSGRGEAIELVHSDGTVIDRVNFELGFPWPTVGDAPGNSLELIHPSLDNTLGGNWRSSLSPGSGQPDQRLIDAGGSWRYFKGTSEPSPTTGAWRLPEFNDSAWTVGSGPVGYDPDVLGLATTGGSRLTDMRGNYSTIYLRQTFNAASAEGYGRIRLEALFDDGFKAWLNGRLLVVEAMPNTEAAFNSTSTSVRENNGYQIFEATLPAGLLRPSGNVLAIHVANSSLRDSSDCFFDGRMSLIGATVGQGPTPGRINRTLSTNAPPALRQIVHQPQSPRSGQPVVITIKATDPDGIGSLVLEYQVVKPGEYVRVDSPEYGSNWSTVIMNDAGISPDTTANDGVYRALIPGSLQEHRNLVRYRIRATDSKGASVQVPYPDDEARNFAYFVYDGVPEWSGAIRPGDTGALGRPFTVPTNEMNRLPVYHLLAQRKDVEDATWRDRSHGDEYFWRGTLVYEDQVYENIRFRPRGGVWRYAMGKNLWKFDFNRGHDFRGRDNWGRRFNADWTKLNLGSSIQQGDYLHRGEHGMFESVGFRLFQLTGATGCDTAFVQFRIVDAVGETPPESQYAGDFWGVYLAVEQPDGRYLESHHLPDGNLYKMEGGFGDPNNLGPDGPIDSSDLSTFMAQYNQSPSESWWGTNFNLPSYYNYQAIVQAIHHYDIADGKNYYYYRNPVTSRWQVIPWDLDLTWSDNMYRAGQTGGDEPFKSRILNNFNWNNPRLPTIARQFRNRIREIRDLLWNADEAFRLLDEHSRLLRGTNQWSLIDADRAQWDYNPVMVDGSVVNTSKAGWGRYYQSGVGSRDFKGMVAKMRNYVLYRGSNPTFSLDTIAAEASRPQIPVIAYTGAPGHPVDQLEFVVSAYSGSSAAAAVRWRIAEISQPGHPAYDPSRPLPYEIEATVDSGDLTPTITAWVPPPGSLRPGRLYRARVQFRDVVGRTSQWSLPTEFTASEPLGASSLSTDLEITELMYNPPEDGFEFLEIHNRHLSRYLDLSGARFTSGINFDFSPGVALEPGEYALLLRTTNTAAFRLAYQLPESIRILGTYTGALANEGETLTIKAAAGSTNQVTMTYSSAPTWPPEANGGGKSLVPRETGTGSPSQPTFWRASFGRGGSPGGPDTLIISSIRRVVGGLELRFNSVDPAVQVWISQDLRAWSKWDGLTQPGRALIPERPDGGVGFIRLQLNVR